MNNSKVINMNNKFKDFFSKKGISIPEYGDWETEIPMIEIAEKNLGLSSDFGTTQIEGLMWLDNEEELFVMDSSILNQPIFAAIDGQTLEGALNVSYWDAIKVLENACKRHGMNVEDWKTPEPWKAQGKTRPLLISMEKWEDSFNS